MQHPQPCTRQAASLLPSCKPAQPDAAAPRVVEKNNMEKLRTNIAITSSRGLTHIHRERRTQNRRRHRNCLARQEAKRAYGEKRCSQQLQQLLMAPAGGPTAHPAASCCGPVSKRVPAAPRTQRRTDGLSATTDAALRCVDDRCCAFMRPLHCLPWMTG